MTCSPDNVRGIFMLLDTLIYHILNMLDLQYEIATLLDNSRDETASIDTSSHLATLQVARKFRQIQKIRGNFTECVVH